MRRRVDKLSPSQHFDLWELWDTQGHDVRTVLCFNPRTLISMDFFVTSDADIQALRNLYETKGWKLTIVDNDEIN